MAHKNICKEEKKSLCSSILLHALMHAWTEIIFYKTNLLKKFVSKIRWSSSARATRRDSARNETQRQRQHIIAFAEKN